MVEKLIENTENKIIKIIVNERIITLNGVFFICFNIFIPAEKIR